MPARADPFVKRHIDAFAALMNFQIEVTNLDLASVWPCRRHRTWWIVYDRCLSPVGLCEWPTLSCLAKVQCLIPYICRWDPRDELALCLDARECLAFGVDDGTYPKHMLSAEGVAPTALHAWGSQLRACPCGCRDFGLSAQRLQEKGLFGLLVASQSEALHEQCIRHVHPSEALALNAMDCTIDFGLNVRLTLSGVGQIASPLQAIWVLSFVTARVEMLSRGVAPFEPLSQLHAFRSWLLMKCQTAWPCNDQVVQDQKLCELVGFWHDVRSLSLEQMLHVPEWPEMRDDHISVAAALDLLIRRAHAAKSNPCSVIHEPETPWFELPEHHQPCDVLLHVGASEVSFVDAQGSRGVFRFQAGATISDVLTAHAKLTGSFAVSHILDSFGQAVSIDQCMQAGHDIRVFFSVTGVESPFDFDVKVAGPKFQSVAIASDLTHEALDGDVSMDASCEPGGVKPDTVVAASGNPVQVVSTISPTAIWSGSVDMSEVNPMPEECLATTLPYHQSGGQVAALMSLTEKQFLRLAVPNLDDETKFRSLRQQFVKSADRLSLLEVQGNIWSDDEVAYHLSILTSGHDPCTGLPPDVLTIDPLLCAAWIDNRAFPIGIWACHHPEVLNKGVQVMGVSRLQSHWVPFHIVPCKEHANVHTWDAPSNDHSLLNQFLESLVLALGFSTVLVTRLQRLVPITEKCGALAIHYLHSALHGTQLLTQADEVDSVHNALRLRFAELVSKSEYVLRPWIWGSGDGSEDAEESPCPGGPASEDSPDLHPEPRFEGRVFPVVSPQSDPSVEAYSDQGNPLSDAEVPLEPTLVPSEGRTTRSRSPLRPHCAKSSGLSLTASAVPAPDADSLWESGPLPRMPDEPERLPRYIEHELVPGDNPVLFALAQPLDNNRRSIRGLYDVGAYSRELWGTC